MATGRCGDCWHYNKNKFSQGCFASEVLIRPNSSETCRLNPPQFREKPPDTSESRGPEGFPQTWHLTGQKPRIEKAAVITKKKGKAKVARDVKSGRFVKK